MRAGWLTFYSTLRVVWNITHSILIHNYKSLAWPVLNGPGSGSGASQSAFSSGPEDSRSWEEPSWLPQRDAWNTYMYSRTCL